MHTLLPSLLYLKLWFCPELESFSEGGLPSNLQILEIISCEKLFLRRMEWGLQSLHSLREIRIWYDGREVGSFPEEALLPPSLIGERILDIYMCPLLEKRYRRKNGKEWRKISHIPIIRIDNEVIT